MKQLVLAAAWTATAASAAFAHGGHGPARGPTEAPVMVLSERSRTAIPNVPKHEIRVLTATVAPGDASVWHTHAASPVVYVISGTMRLEMQGRPAATLGKGQALVEPTGVVMRAVNPSDREPLVLVIFQASDPARPFLDEVHR